jgi:quinoprotein glucose dehydrogenase
MWVALKSDQPRLRNEARRVLVAIKPNVALPELTRSLESGTTVEKQTALTLLGTMAAPQAQQTLGKQFDALLEKKLPAELQLEVLEAARASKSGALRKKLARYEASLSRKDPLAHYRETLAGGDAERGRSIFFNKADVSCLRCHKTEGQGGEVGPDLAGIGTKQKRDYLLESVVDPNRQIAKGFETVVVTTSNGKSVSGIVKAETKGTLTLITPEAKLVTIKKGDIEERQAGKSAMPEDLIKHLSRAELRDLVEYLACLKQGK